MLQGISLPYVFVCAQGTSWSFARVILIAHRVLLLQGNRLVTAYKGRPTLQSDCNAAMISNQWLDAVNSSLAKCKALQASVEASNVHESYAGD